MVIRFLGDVVEFINADIERIQHEIAAEHNYEIVDHNLVLYVRPVKKDGIPD